MVNVRVETWLRIDVAGGIRVRKGSARVCELWCSARGVAGDGAMRGGLKKVEDGRAVRKRGVDFDKGIFLRSFRANILRGIGPSNPLYGQFGVLWSCWVFMRSGRSFGRSRDVMLLHADYVRARRLKGGNRGGFMAL